MIHVNVVKTTYCNGQNISLKSLFGKSGTSKNGCMIFFSNINGKHEKIVCIVKESDTRLNRKKKKVSKERLLKLYGHVRRFFKQIDK